MICEVKGKKKPNGSTYVVGHYDGEAAVIQEWCRLIGYVEVEVAPLAPKQVTTDMVRKLQKALESASKLDHALEELLVGDEAHTFMTARQEDADMKAAPLSVRVALNKLSSKAKR